MAATRRSLLALALSVTAAQGLLTASHLPPGAGKPAQEDLTDGIPPLAGDSMMYPEIVDTPFTQAGFMRRSDDNGLLMDVYMPQGTSDPVPALIYVHPGCWKEGTKNMLRAWADRFVNELGIAVVTFEYRHSDEAPWPAQGEDVLDAIRWVKTAGSTIGLDTNYVGCMGESSGAHLCLYMATAGAANWETRPNVAVSMFGQTCFLCQGYTDEFPMPYGGYNNRTVQDELFGFDYDTLRNLKEHEGNPDAAQAKQIELVQSAEPLYQLAHVSKGNTSHIFIAQGDLDYEVAPAEATYFSEELEKHSVTYTLLKVPDGGHSYMDWQNSHIMRAVNFVEHHIWEQH